MEAQDPRAWDLGLFCPRCPPFTPTLEGLPALRLGLWAPRKWPGGSGLFGQRGLLIPAWRMVGVAAARGISGGRLVAFPAWPPVFLVQKKKNPILLLPRPHPHPSPCFRWMELDGVTREALGRGARGGGAPRGGGASPQPGLAAPAAGSAVGPLPGLARRLGREGGHPGAVRLAASREEESPGAHPGCLCLDGGAPGAVQRNFTRAHGLPPCRPLWQPKFSGRKCNGFLF